MRKDSCPSCENLKDYRAKICRDCHSYKLKNNEKYNSNYKHGHATEKPTKTYMVWGSMVQRCENIKSRQYPDYGGRGIFVCDRWKIYENFLEDMGEKPDLLCIDRINNDDGYYKDNCRWVTHKVNNNNKRIHYR